MVAVALAAREHDVRRVSVVDEIAESERLACLELVVAAQLPAVHEHADSAATGREQAFAAPERQLIDTA